MKVVIKLDLTQQEDKDTYTQFLESSKNEADLKQLKIDFKKVVSRMVEIYLESRNPMCNSFKLDEEIKYISNQVNSK